MKKALYVIPLLLLLFLVGLLAGWFYLRSLLTEDFIVAQIESALNARAEIRELDIDLFSAISSIELEGVRLAARDAAANKGVPLAERQPLQNALISAESVELSLSFLPLLSRRFEIRHFVIDRPEIKLIHYASGANNLENLFVPPQIVNGKPNPALAEKPEPQDQGKPAASAEAFTVKTLPVSAGLERIAVQNGTVHVSIPSAGHRLKIANLGVALTDFDVDPKDLQNHNQALLAFDADVQVFGTAGKESGRLGLRSRGFLKLFDSGSGQVNPDLVYGVRMLQGSYISNMSLMEQLAGRLPLLKAAGLSLKGVGDRAELARPVDMQVRYRAGRITLLKEVVFPTHNYDLQLKQTSWLLVDASSHQFQGRILASAAESARAIKEVDATITRNVKDEDPAKYRKLLLGELLQGDRIALDFISTGPLARPQIYLKSQIPSLTDILKDSARAMIKNQIQNKLREELDKNKQLKEGLDRLMGK